MEEVQGWRRRELLSRKSLTIAEDRELQSLLYKYREELKRRHTLDKCEAVDLQWILDHPPETRLGELRREEEWDKLMETHGVYRRGDNGHRILGPSGDRLEEYEASRHELQIGRMRIGSRGDVIPYDAKGHLLVLPAVNLPMTVEGVEGRKVFLFAMSDRAKISRLKALEHLAASGAELTEWEKCDLDYLRTYATKMF